MYSSATRFDAMESRYLVVLDVYMLGSCMKPSVFSYGKSVS